MRNLSDIEPQLVYENVSVMQYPYSKAPRIVNHSYLKVLGAQAFRSVPHSFPGEALKSAANSLTPETPCGRENYAESNYFF